MTDLASASLLGRPDIGLLGLAEMADQLRRIVGAVAVPVVADADTGYGNAVNVARTDPDLVVIARTDARAVEGLDAAIARAWACREAGADLLFVEALEGVEEIEVVARELAGVPLVFNWAEGGRTPPLPFAQIEQLGFALIITPLTALLAATAAMTDALAALARDRTPLRLLAGLPTFEEFLGIVGLADAEALAERYS